MGEEEVSSARWWFKKLDQGREVKGESKITTDKHCILSNQFPRVPTIMRGMPIRWSWLWGIIRTKSSFSVPLFVRRWSTRRTSPRGKQLCFHLHKMNVYSVWETALVKKFFHIWRNRKSNKKTKKD